MQAAFRPINLLDLSLAREGEEACFNANIKPFSEAELAYRAEVARRSINSRPMGLLEVPSMESLGAAASVQYLHRTVRDYFHRDYVIQHFKSGLPEEFQADATLAAVYLWKLKATEFHWDDVELSGVIEFWNAFYRCSRYVCNISRPFQKTQIRVCLQLEKASDAVWNTTVTRNGYKQMALDNLKARAPQRGIPQSCYFWGNTLIEYDTESAETMLEDAHNIRSFFDVAFHLKLYPYVRIALGKDITLDHRIDGFPLLEIALGPFCDLTWK
jgi:hypothetical protein